MIKRRLSSSEENLPNLIEDVTDDKVTIILNRPKALNAFSRSLCENIYEALKRAERRSLVIIKGAGDRAFSAGGDLFKLESASRGRDLGYISSSILYLNASIYLIKEYKIPVVALLDGIAFGGGAGLPIFAQYRITTEKTKFSMPEVKLGFHPNVAATYFFNHSDRKLGYYLALTGEALTAADVVHAGYATNFCQHSNVEALERELLKCSNSKEIREVIERVCEKNLPEFSLKPLMGKINACFSEPTIEGILSKLKEDGSLWAEKTLNKMNQYSPTALKVILRQLQKGKNMNLEECLIMESNLTVNFFNYPDVLEGIRITLKDRNDFPKWCPSSLSEVTEELIEDYFKPYDEARQKCLLQEVVDTRK